MGIPRTWKICTNIELKQKYDALWDEVEARAVAIGRPRVKKPPLYTFNRKTAVGECRSRVNDLAPPGQRIIPTAIAVHKAFLKYPEKATETLIHEIAHAFHPKDQHGPTWKAIGLPVARKHGVDLNRATSCEKLGISEEDWNKA